jgi:hypothetical protein
MPVMVLLMSERGLSLATIGAVTAVHGILIVALELPTGALSDAVGRRSVLAAAAALNLMSFALIVGAHTAWLFVVAAVLKGVGRALSTGPAQAWYVETVHATDPAGDLRGGLSAGATAGSAALAGGVLGGGCLPLALAAAGASVDLALAVPALLAALASAALLLVALLALPEPGGRVRLRFTDILFQTPRTVGRGLRLVLGDPVLRLALSATMACGLALNVIELLTPGRLAALSGGAASGAAGYAVVAAVGFGASAAGSAVAPLVGRAVRAASALAAVGVLTAGAGVLALAATAPLTGTAGLVTAGAAYALMFAGLGLMNPAQSELLNARARATERATVISVDSLALQLAGIIGALTLVPMAGNTGPAAAWYIAGGVLVAATLAYLAIGRLGLLRLPRPAGTGVASVTVVGVTGALDHDEADATISKKGA